ncbi:hypothetical protein NSPZN2_11028 [Nitrospira defluvii]|uniref:Transposase n=1 Tax=Nitrospira defluvii TaxID=330214 RepID=A0ABM8QNN8_9BACT|nr:hypothetical protein NSPZN2_11028 [Nitrospira defluvii]
MRFRALGAAIVRIVRRRDRERTQISSFLSGARKKVWQAFLVFWAEIRGRRPTHSSGDGSRVTHGSGIKDTLTGTSREGADALTPLVMRRSS